MRKCHDNRWIEATCDVFRMNLKCQMVICQKLIWNNFYFTYMTNQCVSSNQQRIHLSRISQRLTYIAFKWSFEHMAKCVTCTIFTVNIFTHNWSVFFESFVKTKWWSIRNANISTEIYGKSLSFIAKASLLHDCRVGVAIWIDSRHSSFLQGIWLTVFIPNQNNSYCDLKSLRRFYSDDDSEFIPE